MKIRAIALGAVALALTACGVAAQATNNDPPSNKVFVCKYVNKPGGGELLQTGQNPISVSVNAIPGGASIGKSFADAQGRSVVIAWDTGQSGLSCPPGNDPPATTTTEPDDDDQGTTTTTEEEEGTTTTGAPCPDCGINTVVIVPTSITTIPGVPTQNSVPVGPTTTAAPGATTTTVRPGVPTVVSVPGVPAPTGLPATK